MISDCTCCGMPISHGVAEVTECDGCRFADHMPSETWHCDHRGGHNCDGSACNEHGPVRGA